MFAKFSLQNSISKFKATKLLGSDKAKEIERQADLAGRKFNGTLTEMPDVDWFAEVDRLSVDDELKVQIKEKLNNYVRKMSDGSKR